MIENYFESWWHNHIWCNENNITKFQNTESRLTITSGAEEMHYLIPKDQIMAV
jgi:hypothetical protein